MGLLSIPIFFLLLVLIVFAVVFPRFLRGALIALTAFVGVAWLIGSTSDKTTPPRHESRRVEPSHGALGDQVGRRALRAR
jgi:hypothetical protein